MGRAFLERLRWIMERRAAMKTAILAAYDVVPNARVRRLEVARKVAETLRVPTVTPQFQIDVRQVAISLGARTVKKGNARFYRGLQARAKDG